MILQEDYFDKTKIKARWQNPSNIKVYIASNVGKEVIFKKAFATWDDKLYKSINFSYVTEENKADIVIKFVDALSGNKAGVTEYPQIWNLGSKEYLKKVVVKVALQNPQGGKYTDTNLLAIALHEIGHALGISYHSDNLNDIMYYSTETYKNGSISKRDVNTVQRIYR
jgi:predicted Zn-dependent protease